jgi:hypothetical protein
LLMFSSSRPTQLCPWWFKLKLRLFFSQHKWPLRWCSRALSSSQTDPILPKLWLPRVQTPIPQCGKSGGMLLSFRTSLLRCLQRSTISNETSTL